MAAPGPRNEYGSMDFETGQILKNLMNDRFIHGVNTLALLSPFLTAEKKTLTDLDISYIRARCSSSGEILGAQELLDRLVKYDCWFSVLQGILRREDINLGHLADDLDKFHDQAYKKRLDETVAVQQNGSNSTHEQNDFTSSVSPTQPLQNQNYQTSKEDDLNLDDLQGDDAPDSNELKSDMPKPKNDKESPRLSLPSSAMTPVDETMVKKTEEMSLQPAPSRSSSTQKTLPGVYGASRPINPSSDGYEVMPSTSSSGKEDNEYDEIDDDYCGGAAAACASSMPRVERQARSQYENAPISRQKLPCHIPPSKNRDEPKKKTIREFSFVETDCELNRFEGWHVKQSDKQVVQAFKDILDQKKDGYYMLWFWEKKKRPAICVSHKGKLITFIIHRRCDRSNPRGYIYYIVDQSTSKTSLSDLFQYHKDNGLPNMTPGSDTKEIIKLKHPI